MTLKDIHATMQDGYETDGPIFFALVMIMFLFSIPIVGPFWLLGKAMGYILGFERKS